MSNEINRTQSRLWAHTTDSADGLALHETEVGVKQNTEALLRSELADAKLAEKAWQDAQQAETDALAAHRTASSNVKGFLGLTKRQLADEAGLIPAGLWPVGTYAIPDDETKRITLIDKIAVYLQEHSSAENGAKNFTALRALALSKALTDGRTALNDAVRTRVKAKGTRDDADSAVYDRLSALLSELGHLLADDSEDWYWFGFVPPAGAERPVKPEGLHLEKLSSTALMAGWPHPARAEKSRLLVQVVGRDADFIPQPWVHDNDDTLTGLPANATIRIKLVSSNAAGESPESNVAELVLS